MQEKTWCMQPLRQALCLSHMLSQNMAPRLHAESAPHSFPSSLCRKSSTSFSHLHMGSVPPSSPLEDQRPHLALRDCLCLSPWLLFPCFFSGCIRPHPLHFPQKTLKCLIKWGLQGVKFSVTVACGSHMECARCPPPLWLWAWHRHSPHSLAMCSEMGRGCDLVAMGGKLHSVPYSAHPACCLPCLPQSDTLNPACCVAVL